MQIQIQKCKYKQLKQLQNSTLKMVAEKQHSNLVKILDQRSKIKQQQQRQSPQSQKVQQVTGYATSDEKR